MNEEETVEMLDAIRIPAIAMEFSRLRFDPNHHLGLGDIRLTLGMQDEIVEQFKRLERELAAAKEYAEGVEGQLRKANLAVERLGECCMKRRTRKEMR